MGLFQNGEEGFARAVSKVVYCNPFLPERIGFERDALGEEFDERAEVWSIPSGHDVERPNVEKLSARTEAFSKELRGRLMAGVKGTPAELQLYKDVALYHMFYHTYGKFRVSLRGSGDIISAVKVDFYDEFLERSRFFFDIPGVVWPTEDTPEHILAMFFQIRRAFGHIYSFIVGSSLPIARLRANTWRSIFTHDLRRYYRVLYGHMGDMTTLIEGESGTGKELVARAIGLSRYVPFDPKKRVFEADYRELFVPLNLSAMSPTLIESELFGHRRGAFTGAIEDRVGWLETCPALGTVFLDEIGELDPLIQVKMLRVLQVRTFQRIGDTKTRQFAGKLIAATNRDLAAEMAAGRFREDFYYRLCGDVVRTPTLREQLEASPEELRHLVLFIAKRIAGDEAEALAEEVVGFIRKKLPGDYAWAGNFRELEQCVRNILIRQEYAPPQRRREGEAFVAQVAAGELTLDELISGYCRRVYGQEGTYEGAARRLGMDRRTVKARVDGAVETDPVQVSRRGEAK